MGQHMRIGRLQSPCIRIGSPASASYWSRGVRIAIARRIAWQGQRRSGRRWRATVHVAIPPAIQPMGVGINGQAILGFDQQKIDAALAAEG